MEEEEQREGESGITKQDLVETSYLLKSLLREGSFDYMGSRVISKSSAL